MRPRLMCGAALRSGAPGTGQAEQAGRGTAENERPAGRSRVLHVKNVRSLLKGRPERYIFRA